MKNKYKEKPALLWKGNTKYQAEIHWGGKKCQVQVNIFHLVLCTLAYDYPIKMDEAKVLLR